MEFVEKFLSFGGPPAGPLSPLLGHVVTTVLALQFYGIITPPSARNMQTEGKQK